MEDNRVWPPPPENQVLSEEPVARHYLFLWVPLSAIGVGTTLGLLDIFRTDSLVDWLTFGAAVVLGFLHPKTFLFSAFLLSLCLYLIHIVAIQHGFKPPYVEANVDGAMYSWQSLLPNGFGGLLGAVVKLFEQYGKEGSIKP